MRGALKSSEQWQVVWRDIKSRTSVRAREIKKARATTGNKPITAGEFTELEEKVLGIIGSEYVEGNRSCPDSLPEQEELQQALIAGDSQPLEMVPETISIFDEGIHLNADNTRDSAETDCANKTDEPRNDVQDSGRPGSSTGQSISRKRKIMRTPGSSSPLKRYRRSRNDSAINDSREEFREIAQKHAEANMIMAQAVESLAATAKHQVTVMEKLVNIEAERTPIINILLDVMQSLLPTYLE